MTAATPNSSVLLHLTSRKACPSPLSQETTLKNLGAVRPYHAKPSAKREAIWLS